MAKAVSKTTVADVVTERILAQLEKGIVPWKQPWKSATPSNWQGKPYRGINWLLLSSSDREDPRWISFNQIKTQGGKLKEGSKSEMVTFYKKAEFTDDEGKTKPYMIMRYTHVFNIGDTEGCKGIPPLDEYLGAAKDFGTVTPEFIMQNMASKPEIKHGGADAYYARSPFDYIQLPHSRHFDSAEAYLAVFMHELIHATGDATRLDRPKGIKHGDDLYAAEERVAEIGAGMGLAYFGIDQNVENSASYIHGWMKDLKGDSKIIITAASAAQKALDYILGVEVM